METSQFKPVNRLKKVEITEKLYVTNRDEWRAWLEKNHNTKKEIWLIYYKKHTRKPTIAYDDAVEEALCFGWIDSIVKRIDDEKFTRKFTPRKDKSKWSESNKRRARKMIREGRMTKVGLALFKEPKKKKGSKVEVVKEKFIVPPDLKKALAKNKRALENFNNFAHGYKKLYILWILDAKKKETREKRIRQAIKLLAQNKKLGLK